MTIMALPSSVDALGAPELLGCYANQCRWCFHRHMQWLIRGQCRIWVHKSVMCVPESYYVRAVIHCTQMNYSQHAILAGKPILPQYSRCVTNKSPSTFGIYMRDQKISFRILILPLQLTILHRPCCPVEHSQRTPVPKHTLYMNPTTYVLQLSNLLTHSLTHSLTHYSCPRPQ